MKVDAFQCDICGTLHKDESSMDACFSKCTTEKGANKTGDLVNSFLDECLNYPRLHATDFVELERLIENTVLKLVQTTISVSIKLNREVTAISNTYRAPIGGITNWSRQSNIPIRYRGLTGTLTITGPKQDEFFGCGGRFRIQGIHATRGDYIGKDQYKFDLTIFLDDFPLIKEAITEIETLDAMRVAEVAQLREKRNIKKLGDAELLRYNNSILIAENTVAATQRQLDILLGERMDYLKVTYEAPIRETNDKNLEIINGKWSKIYNGN